MEIRLYVPGDRPAVRRICAETADCGRPAERFFPDRELLADLVTRYFTDFEPAHTWVAVAEGGVVGYLTAAFDGDAFRRRMVWPIVPAALAAAVGRGLLWRRAAWRLVWAQARSLPAYARHGTASLGRACPAQLHVDLLEGHRGLRLGERLMEAFAAAARAAGVPGVCAAVRGDNAAGCAFFRKEGFTARQQYSILLPLGTVIQEVPIVLFARDLR